jgi:endonuclease/exonuclease/phosphatase family metal-dependent hydrolase
MTSHPGIVVRALTWNLFHGRDNPPDPALLTWRSRLLRRPERNATHIQVNRSLREEFADWLAGEAWELALLQEVPPRWLEALGRACRAHGAMALTSRNEAGRLRGLLADWNPDLIASNEGGSNQTLVRAPARIVEVRRLTLTEAPERRRMLFTQVEAPGALRIAVANLHATAGNSSAAARDVEMAAERAVDWAGEVPLLFGGDLNLRPQTDPDVFERLRARHGLAAPTGPRALDHLLARGFEVVEPPEALAAERREVPGPDGLRIRLSDHPPVAGSFGMR